ncbi:carbohydrate kinase family protein [Microbacterium sp.]|uniref:carbohydrate kinase family protein n=1 Tax=Microbacterium sp. TaxID=51671 RepID=UPI0039E449EE
MAPGNVVGNRGTGVSEDGLAHDPRPVYEQLVSAADIVFAREDEAALLVGNAEAPVLAERLRRLGPREVVIRRGAHGAFASDGTTCHDEPARRVDVVDTVGAGDAFVAGYLSLCGGSASLVERLRRGVAVGAFACTSAGDGEGSPTLAELSRMDDEEGVVR